MTVVAFFSRIASHAFLFNKLCGHDVYNFCVRMENMKMQQPVYHEEGSKELRKNCESFEAKIFAKVTSMVCLAHFLYSLNQELYE